jgi:TDG/mug DNA glycosylase family protein
MDKLPDLLAPDLQVVFCGTAAGRQSAARGAYYAHPGNRFWRVLAETGLTPRQLAPQEYAELLQYGIGLTDLTKMQAGIDSEVRHNPADVEAFKAKIKEYHPRVLALTSKETAKRFYGRKTAEYGRQPDPLGDTVIFVLPSTSGLATSFWDESHWSELAAFLAREGVNENG